MYRANPRVFRVREIITSRCRISPSGQLGLVFTRTILSVGLAILAVVLPLIDPIFPKSGRECCEGLVS